jgi:hypothetical protein
MSQKTNQPVEKGLVEFVEERMSLAEHQITLRRYTGRKMLFKQKERAEIDKSQEHAVQ